MKKLILLLLVLTGGVLQANAQRETDGTIRVAFTDPSGKWAQSNFLMYVYGTSTGHDDEWPGVDITSNTIEINGATYYYRDFPIDYYGVGFRVIAVNQDGEGGNRSQSENLTWCYDRASITGDTYYSLKDEWSGSNRKAELKEMYYIADYDNPGKVLLATQSGTNYSASFSTSDFLNFVVANSYAFKDDGTLDFEQNSGYPANIYRPNTEKELAFANVDKTVSDTQRDEFYRWHNAGYWNAANINGVDLDMSFTIENFNPTHYSIEPYFKKSIKAALSNGSYYATFSSQYPVAVPDGLTMYWADGSQSVTTSVTMTEITDGLPENEGAFLKATSENAEYTFYAPVSTDVVTGNLLKPTEAFVLDTNKNQYIFAKKGTDVGFYKIESSDPGFEIGKAFLEIDKGGGSRLDIVIDDEPTGIQVINTGVNETNMDNGLTYDLQGRRVDSNYHGVVIKNGKKVVVR